MVRSKAIALKPAEAGYKLKIEGRVHGDTRRESDPNLEHESAGGFSLPLSPGRFFPDFIAELEDGRIAIIEYKGGHLAQRPEELHADRPDVLGGGQVG